MVPERTLARAEAERQQGKAWRAKEILQGLIRSHGYHPDLFVRYGELLLEMGDTLEAGKYLFLSGVRKPEYEEAIRLYLQRHRNADLNQLVDSFPGVARCHSFEEYPEPVAAYLRQRAVASGKGALRESRARRRTTSDDFSWGCAIAIVIAIAVFLMLGALTVLGAVYLVQILAGLLS